MFHANVYVCSFVVFICSRSFRATLKATETFYIYYMYTYTKMNIKADKVNCRR